MTYGISLFPQHAQLLSDSGITPEHAHARGYRSVDTKQRLETVGVTPSGRHVPGLLVPSLRADGSVWGYQYRPDSPRLRDGKPIKYESPVNQRNGLDVPPGVGPMLGDPAVPLWVTEGVKKADAGAVAGLCIIALPGVWSWRGRNDHGGKTAVPDWHDVALNGRRVVLAFDSDVIRKASVRRALGELAGYLRSKGASVEFCHLPDDDPGKTGLDDYLAAGHSAADLVALVRPEPPAVTPAGSAGSAASAGQSEGGQRTGNDPTHRLYTEKVSDQSRDRSNRPDGPPETGQLLGDVRRWLARFIITMHPADLDVLTLWAAHTHLCFETYTTPRLLLDSPVPGSGKTTVLEHLERLCHRPIQMASLSSPALLTRMLDAELRTLLIDEADRSLSPDKPDVGEFLAVLNSGYKRGGTRPVLVPSKEGGWNAKEMPTFCPVAMAGNNPTLPEDTKQRSIRVLLMPDFYGTAEESEWEQLDAEARDLGERLARWSDQVRDSVRTSRPPMPETVTGRARERWSPLKRVAVAAGGRWPEVVDTLAVQDVARIEAEREEGIVTERPAVVLLRHLRSVWEEGETFVATDDLIDRLVSAHPDVWGAMSTFGKRLTPQRLGRMLVTAYNVHSDRPDSNGPRGYLAATLRPVFLRFGMPLSQRPAKPAEPAEPAGDPTVCSNCGNPLNQGVCVRCLTGGMS